MKTKKSLKKFLLLIIGSIIGFIVCTLLHNFFYALQIITEHIFLLPHLMGLLHVIFFLIGVLICPIGLLIGSIGILGRIFKLW